MAEEPPSKSWKANMRPKPPKMTKVEKMKAEIAAKKHPPKVDPPKDDAEFNLEVVESIPGLIYVPDFITEDEETAFVQGIEAKEWDPDLKRRVQQYGYRFHHESQHIKLWTFKDGNKLPAADPIPAFLHPVMQRMVDAGYYSRTPEQTIINEYLPGQGIHPHIDKTHCFEEVVASISLLSPCVMDFRHTRTFEKKAVLLPPRALLILTGESRYDWTHGIESKETDTFNGKEFARQRRISVTFRLVIQEYLFSEVLRMYF